MFPSLFGPGCCIKTCKIKAKTYARICTLFLRSNNYIICYITSKHYIFICLHIIYWCFVAYVSILWTECICGYSVGHYVSDFPNRIYLPTYGQFLRKFLGHLFYTEDEEDFHFTARLWADRRICRVLRIKWSCWRVFSADSAIVGTNVPNCYTAPYSRTGQRYENVKSYKFHIQILQAMLLYKCVICFIFVIFYRFPNWVFFFWLLFHMF